MSEHPLGALAASLAPPAWIAEDARRVAQTEPFTGDECAAFLAHASRALTRAGVEDVREKANEMLRCEIDMSLTMGRRYLTVATIGAAFPSCP